MNEITTIKVKKTSRTNLKLLSAKEEITMQDMLDVLIDVYKKYKEEIKEV